LDISQLKTFIEVCETRHFGKAAKSLFITQSTVSARIRLLEEALGVRLLTRDRNNIQLTAAGTRFVPLAKQMLTTWNLAKQSTGLEEESKILFSLGGVFSLWASGLQNTIFKFYRDNPSVAVNLIAQTQEQLFRSVLDYTVDAGFMYDQPQISELESTSLGAIELVLVSTIRDQIAENLMNREDYLFVNWGTAFAVAHARNFPDIPSPSIKVDFARIALDYLLEFGGTAYLAKSMIENELKEDKLFIVADTPVIHRDFYLVYRSNSIKRDLIESLLTKIIQFK